MSFLVGLVACAPAATPKSTVTLRSAPPPATESAPSTHRFVTYSSRWACTSTSLSENDARHEFPPWFAGALERQLARVDEILAAKPPLDEETRSALIKARANLEAEQWPEAIRVFGAIAFADPPDDVGAASAELYLDGLNVLASDSNMPHNDCRDELDDRLPKLESRYCQYGANRQHPKVCYAFYKMERALETRVGCGMVEPSKEPVAVLYARGGAYYLALASRCLEITRLVGISPFDEHCDEYAFYAARAFLNVPDMVQATQARTLLLDPQNGISKSPRIQELEKLWP